MCFRKSSEFHKVKSPLTSDPLLPHNGAVLRRGPEAAAMRARHPIGAVGAALPQARRGRGRDFQGGGGSSQRSINIHRLGPSELNKEIQLIEGNLLTQGLLHGVQARATGESCIVFCVPWPWRI